MSRVQPRVVPTSIRSRSSAAAPSARRRTLLAALGLLAGAACAPAPRTRAQLVTLDAPTGDALTDRRTLQAAIGTLRPGDTLQFAAGTYRLGGGLVVPVPDVLLRGATAGTVLEGCSPAAVQAMGEAAFVADCAGLVLTGARQQVRGLTFARFSTALVLAGGRDSLGTRPNREGGQRIEGNTFRESSRLEVWHDADAPAVIRDNRFVHLQHPLQVLGRQVEVRDNRIDAPDAARVPYAWPAAAISVRPVRGGRCGDVVIAGNTVGGHVDGIVLAVHPDDAAGVRCARVRVEDNTIVLPTLSYPAHVPRLAGAPLRGVGVRVANLQRALSDGLLGIPAPGPERAWPPAFADAVIGDVRVERNVIEGAAGVAMEFVHVAALTLAANRIAPVRPLDAAERDALVRVGTVGDGAGLWLLTPDWRAANGREVWQWPAPPTDTAGR